MSGIKHKGTDMAPTIWPRGQCCEKFTATLARSVSLAMPWMSS